MKLQANWMTWVGVAVAGLSTAFSLWIATPQTIMYGFAGITLGVVLTLVSGLLGE